MEHLHYRKKMNKLERTKSFLLYAGFLLYVLLLSYVLFLKIVSPLELFSINRREFRNINIIPFYTIYGYLSGILNVSQTVVIHNVLGNIAIFIPLGIYLELFRKDKRISMCIFLVFLISLFVEIIQYIFGLGMSDIDDVILNCLGGLIGILSYKVLALFFKNDEKHNAHYRTHEQN